jgi:uncharacterized protein YbbC (DUF1343 family)
MRVRTGLERLVVGEIPALRGRRIGLIANPTAVDPELRHAVDLLAGAGLTTLFGPEHGLRGDAQDMVGVDMARDARTGLPVWSLYGHDEASLSPTPAMLDGLDVLVYDVQDVGSRYYTFVWTMVLAMRAAARAKIAFAVLDRPNPIGGVLVEGGAIAPGFESFVGLVSCPNRHGLTAGEIARWRADVEKLDVELHVIEMEGWTRAMYFEDTGLPWVMPSPNMPTRDTALVYPGMCLVEGTEASEGRGTTRPFEIAGAPGVDGNALAEALATLPGLIARPLVFTPMLQKHAKTACGGVQLHVTDRDAFRPYHTGVAFLRALRPVWRTRAYEFVDTIPAIDLLCGSAQVREGIDAGASLEDLASTWRDAERAWDEERRKWLLYA